MSRRFYNNMMNQFNLKYSEAREIMTIARTNLGYPASADVNEELEQQFKRLSLAKRQGWDWTSAVELQVVQDDNDNNNTDAADSSAAEEVASASAVSVSSTSSAAGGDDEQPTSSSPPTLLVLVRTATDEENQKDQNDRENKKDCVRDTNQTTTTNGDDDHENQMEQNDREKEKDCVGQEKKHCITNGTDDDPQKHLTFTSLLKNNTTRKTSAKLSAIEQQQQQQYQQTTTTTPIQINKMKQKSSSTNLIVKKNSFRNHVSPFVLSSPSVSSSKKTIQGKKDHRQQQRRTSIGSTPTAEHFIYNDYSDTDDDSDDNDNHNNKGKQQQQNDTQTKQYRQEKRRRSDISDIQKLWLEKEKAASAQAATNAGKKALTITAFLATTTPSNSKRNSLRSSLPDPSAATTGPSPTLDSLAHNGDSGQAAAAAAITTKESDIPLPPLEPFSSSAASDSLALEGDSGQAAAATAAAVTTKASDISLPPLEPFSSSLSTQSVDDTAAAAASTATTMKSIDTAGSTTADTTNIALLSSAETAAAKAQPQLSPQPQQQPQPTIEKQPAKPVLEPELSIDIMQEQEKEQQSQETNQQEQQQEKNDNRTTDNDEKENKPKRKKKKKKAARRSTMATSNSSEEFKPSEPTVLTLINDKPLPVVYSSGTFASKYVLGRELGDGAYSVVREAIQRDTGKLFAAKIVEQDFDYDSKSTGSHSSFHIEDEIRMLLELKQHPNILSLTDVYWEKSTYYLLLEVMLGGELFDRIISREFFNEKDARDVAKTVLGALQHCHERRIAHRDLKPENLLLRSKHNDTDIVLADFGFARKIVHPDSLTTRCGSPGYVAPEILGMNITSSSSSSSCLVQQDADGTMKGKGYDVECDMWSFGVILFVLMGGYAPFEDSNPRELNRKIREGDFEFHEEYWCTVSQDAKDLISSLLTVDRKKRLTAKEALLHSKWVTAPKERLRKLDRSHSLDRLRQFTVKRKLRAAIQTVTATIRFRQLIFGNLDDVDDEDDSGSENRDDE